MENQNTGAKEMPTTNLPFGQAIEALKQGKRVTRQGWNGKGMFVFMQVPSVIMGDIIPKMQSLPQSVKDELCKRLDDDGNVYPISYFNQLAICHSNNVINGWTPSPSDVLENDWMILD